MGLAVLVTGVPGSGKSTVAAELKRMGAHAYSIEDVPGMFSMRSKATGKAKWIDNSSLEEVKRYEWVCDVEKLSKLINRNRKNATVFYCGVAANLDAIFPLFDLVLLLVPPRKELGRRLEQRKTNDFGKSLEVRRWVLGWKQWFEDDMKARGAVIIDSGGAVEDTASKVLEAA